LSVGGGGIGIGREEDLLMGRGEKLGEGEVRGIGMERISRRGLGEKEPGNGNVCGNEEN